MVDKVIVSPKDVRGGGNIISPSKELTDYTGYMSNQTVSSETVNGLPTPVWKSELDITSLGRFTINSQGHLIFTLTSNEDISFSINSNGHLIATGTNENKYSISNNHCIYGG